MAKDQELFTPEQAPKHRKKPRKLMRVYDAGASDYRSESGKMASMVMWKCPHCEHQTDWTHEEASFSELKRGKPCPKCNKPEEGKCACGPDCEECADDAYLADGQKKFEDRLNQKIYDHLLETFKGRKLCFNAETFEGCITAEDIKAAAMAKLQSLCVPVMPEITVKICPDMGIIIDLVFKSGVHEIEISAKV